MKSGSLRRRLLVAGAASIVAALAVAGLGLLLLFERHVERRMVLELESDLRQLVAGLDRGPDGALQVDSAPVDPRYNEPLSGRYWQIGLAAGGAALRSRSLWDATLDLPVDTLADADVHEHAIGGPQGRTLLVVERSVVLPASLGGSRARIAVALDRVEIHDAGRAFAADLAWSLAVLAAVLVAGAWVQVSIGLRPLDTVRQRLRAVRTGAEARLGAEFPDEVRPLVAEVDHLLDEQEAALSRARGRAADLAHGFRTPLTVLAADAEALRGSGQHEMADEIASITDGLRRHVEHELARARAGGGGRRLAASPLAPIVDQIVGVLRRTPKGQGLDWQVDVAEASVSVDRQDLAEMLGNLAENACKWARGTARISARVADGSCVLRVEDDGPGIPEGSSEMALARGGRLDQSQPGSGIGLAIVGDLAEAYGATLSLGRSPLGGLAVELKFPDRR